MEEIKDSIIEKTEENNVNEEDMNIKILKSSIDGTNNNKGGCAALAEYICHEDADRIAAGKEPYPYTTPDGEEVTLEEVISAIDGNHRHLGKNDSKFYGIVVSPSVDEIKVMGTTEKEIYEAGQKLTNLFSDEYAKNFHRDGLIDSSGLVMFWKPHFCRGANGDFQFHIHGIVSRNSAEIDGKNISLSPLTNHKNTQTGPVKGGFDRTAYAKKCEKIFDQLFAFERSVANTMEYQNALKHGTPEKKKEQITKLVAERKNEIQESIAKGIGQRKAKLHTKNEISEIAAILAGATEAMDEHTSKNVLSEALSLADYKNNIIKVFEESPDQNTLDMNLIVYATTCNPLYAENGGVEDLLLNYQGKKLSVKKLMDKKERQRIFARWKAITGQRTATEIAEQAAAKKQAEEQRQKELSQHTRGFKMSF